MGSASLRPTSAPSSKRGTGTARPNGYICSRCGQPKKNHICTAKMKPPPKAVLAAAGTQCDLGITGDKAVPLLPSGNLTAMAAWR